MRKCLLSKRLRVSLVTRKPVFMVSEQVPNNPALQPQELARGLKFGIYEVDRFYWLCNENKGADQLGCYCLAALCLSFCICKKQTFS